MKTTSLSNVLKVSAVALTTTGALAFSSAMFEANAFTISQTGLSGGTPGGLTVYSVTGLVQNDTFQVNYSYDTGTDQDILSALAKVTVKTLTSNNAVIEVFLKNNSTVNDNRLTHFGFRLPGFTALNSDETGGSKLDEAKTGNFPGFPNLSFCGTSGNNCAGGSGGGLFGGDSDTLTFDVAGNFGSTLTLADFATKWQGEPDSYQISGTPVPTPALLPGLIGMGVAALRKRKGEAEESAEA